jgi:hypothetical protein
MNSWNLHIEGAKAIRLPQDSGHMLRLIVATFLMEEIEEVLFKSKNKNQVKNTSKNQEIKKHFSK